MIRKGNTSETPEVPIIYAFHANNLHFHSLVYSKAPLSLKMLCLSSQLRLFNEQDSKKKKSKLTFYGETGHSSKTMKDSVIQNIPILLALFTDFMKNTSL